MNTKGISRPDTQTRPPTALGTATLLLALSTSSFANAPFPSQTSPAQSIQPKPPTIVLIDIVSVTKIPASSLPDQQPQNPYGDFSSTHRVAYDHMARRIKMTVGSSAYRFVYDGNDVAVEFYDEDGDDDVDRTRVYWLLPELDQRIGFVDVADGETNIYYYLCDQVGSVIQVIDESGDVVNQYVYDAYGNVSWDSTNTFEGVENRYLFQGREWDAHRQEYYFRYRTYIPEWGSFAGPDMNLSRGPLGERHGMMNYVAFVNNPLDVRDPMGLDIEVFLPPKSTKDKHEQLLNRLWERKAYLRRLQRAELRDDIERLQRSVRRLSPKARPKRLGKIAQLEADLEANPQINTRRADSYDAFVKALDGLQDVHAVVLAGHGVPGAQSIGDMHLSQKQLVGALQGLRGRLHSEGAALILLGCNVGTESVGDEYVRSATQAGGFRLGWSLRAKTADHITTSDRKFTARHGFDHDWLRARAGGWLLIDPFETASWDYDPRITEVLRVGAYDMGQLDFVEDLLPGSSPGMARLKLRYRALRDE